MKTKDGLEPIIRIKEVLEQKNLTQKEFAEMIGETPQQLSKWVNGVEPCLSALGRIAISLGVFIRDIVWFAGDDPMFNATSRIYIRGEALDGVLQKADVLPALKEYYRWTDQELAGVKLIEYNPDKGEVVLGCVNALFSGAFITWAKKARDCLYRM